jgi:hypothetical protein
MLGSGDPEAERFFAARARAAPDRLCAWFPFDDARDHRVQAGADFFVMPSRFEPCGLGQLYALRYGTLPIVRATGGLVDTVTSYDEASGSGTGFMFDALDPGSLADTIGWAVSTWYDRPAHIEAMRRRGMREDHSWDQAAGEYMKLYLAAYERRRGHGFPPTASAESPAAARVRGEALLPGPVRKEAAERPESALGGRASRTQKDTRRKGPKPKRRLARRAPEG